MALILNIDTSSHHCSVALSQEGEIVQGYESRKEMDHSVSVAPFVKECIDYIRVNQLHLDAVCVTIGPGSYTGLRIGLSLAKGLCFSLDIPLITVSSLDVMAVRGMFTSNEWSGEELIVPMMDARRMEVYTSVLDGKLNRLMEEQPVILEEDSFKEFSENRKIIFVGDGSEKFKVLYKGQNAVWESQLEPHAKYMTLLAEQKFRKGEFADIAYVKPNYLKDFQTTVSKNRL